MGKLKTKKFLMIGILMVLGIFCYGNFALAIIPIMDFNLGNSDASFLGEVAGDLSGYTVFTAGDVNGDGYNDFLIGVSANDEGGLDAGQAYLFLGKAAGWAMDTNLSNADASFIGEAAGDLGGHSISTAGDVNGDGFDDFLITAPSNSEGGPDAGQAYLFLGKAAGWAMDTNLSNADASFIGEVLGDYCGSSVSAVGDVNNDGFGDFLIGANGNDEGGIFGRGQTYLFLGKAAGWAMDTNLSNADASFIGEFNNDFSGDRVSAVGDVNNDGFGDFLISSIRNDEGGLDAGQAYLFLGKAAGWAMDTNLSNADASFIGEAAGDYCGFSVSAVGDVNNDGFGDFLISARDNDEGGLDAGQAYLFLGKAAGWAMDTNLSNADASFIGEAAGDYCGGSVSCVGDVNDDSFNDFLIGAYGNDEGGPDAGQTYLFLGKAAGWAMDTNLSNADASFIGEAAGDYCGFSVSAVGDVNNDGFGDFLISAVGNNDGGVDAGQTYLILSEVPVTVTIKAEDKNNNLIPDGGAVWDYDNNDSIKITSVATANVGGEAIWFHGIHFTIGGNAYNVACGSVGTCSVDICTVPGVDCSADLVAGAVVTYSSTAVDTAINIGSSATKSFSVGTTWARVFSPTVESDHIFSIHQTSDGGYVGGGEIINWGGTLPGDFERPLILKLDKDGTQKWVREVAIVDNWNRPNKACKFIEQTSDDGYILATVNGFYSAANDDILVLKLDSSGIKQWSKVFGNLFNDQSVINGLIRQTSDGGYIIGGHSGFALRELSVIKLNSLGVKVWAKAFGTLNDEELKFIQQTDDDGDGVKDDGYIVLAKKKVIFGLDYDFLVIKLDSLGNKVWAKSYGSTGSEHPYQIQQTADRGYIMIGGTNFYGAGNADFFIIKTDSFGNQKWSKTFGTNDYEGYLRPTIQQTVDGGYIIAGFSKFAKKGLVIKLDSSGNKVWAKTYGDVVTINTPIYFIEQTLDGGYITAGNTSASGNADILILKLDNNGNIANCDSMITDVTGSIIESLKFMTGVTNHIGYNGVNDGSMNEPGGNPSNENLIVTGEIDPCGPCNTVPTVTPNAPDIPTDLEYCSVSPEAISLSWSFSDTEDGVTQTAYRLIIDRSDGASFDSGKIISPITTITCQAINILSAGFVRYGGETYSWDITVYDSGDLTDTKSGVVFKTPIHKYPDVDFDCSLDGGTTWQNCAAISPNAGDVVDFRDLSVAYVTGIPISAWSWDFDNDSVEDDNAQNPTYAGFIAEGMHPVTLIATDSSGFFCPDTQTINVGKGMPKWKEVVPR